jgi:tRNA-Thr(GGU) m(6)t(6)A37 methyltransferase TsaA
MKDHYPPIGTMKTCFTEKFGIPRQSMMISEARGVLKLNPDPSYRVALNHLQQFSHLWIVFVFHEHLHKKWRPTIRPPRIDGPRRVGVFASRSPHRPNPIGLSAVKLEKIDLDAPGGVEIHVSGVDIMDGTPVLDVKPYLPFADRILEANGGWADAEITRYPVTFSSQSLGKIKLHSHAYPNLQQLIAQLLEWDPRPTSQRRAMPIESENTQGMTFAFRIMNFDVKWQIRERAVYVLDLADPVDSSKDTNIT